MFFTREDFLFIIFMALFFQWGRILRDFSSEIVKKIPQAMAKIPINLATARRFLGQKTSPGFTE
jgi:hypothetical protein